MRVLWAVPMVVLLGGCNWLNNITGLAKDSNKAIGAACRQTGRSLEECYMRNPDADKGAIFSGWREMQEYMVKNNLPTLSPPDDASRSSASAPTTASAPAADPLDASAPADDGTAPAPARRSGAGEPAAKSKKRAAAPHHLTNEEAEKEAKHDPEVEAVMSAIRNQSTSDKEKKAKPTGEADQNKLLDIIQKLNGNPGSSNSSSSSSGGAGSGSSLGKPAVPASNSSNNSN